MKSALFWLALALCVEFERKGRNTSEADVEDPMDHANTSTKRRSSEAKYTRLKLVNRKHNSHVHEIGAADKKAFYFYMPRHPSSRHSRFSFHAFDHGMPRSWSEDPKLFPGAKRVRRGRFY